MEQVSRESFCEWKFLPCCLQLCLVQNYLFYVKTSSFFEWTTLIKDRIRSMALRVTTDARCFRSLMFALCLYLLPEFYCTIAGVELGRHEKSLLREHLGKRGHRTCNARFAFTYRFSKILELITLKITSCVLYCIGVARRMAKGPCPPKKTQHILQFCASRGGVTNQVVLLP